MLGRIVEENVLEGVELFERHARTERHGVQRIVGDDDGHAGLVFETGIEAMEISATAGQDDALLHDVGRQLGRRLVEGDLHGVDDGRDGLFDGLADLLGGRDDGLGQAGDEVATANLGVELFFEGPRRTDSR